MNWKLKAQIQKTLDFLPQGAQINYFLQRYVSKGLPVDRLLFIEKVKEAQRHFSHYLRFRASQKTVSKVRAYEFGAGWDLVIPMAYYCFGLRQQTIIDIKSHLKFSLINDTLRRLLEYEQELAGIEHFTGIDEKKGSLRLSSKEQLREYFGIDYKAPVDGRNTGLPADSVDFISSTNTLEHVPAKDVQPLLKECYRLIDRGGTFCCRIDYQDHYAYFDPEISVYNYLQFSTREWKAFNHSIQYQNRLRHSDYLRMARQAGWTLVFQNTYKPTDEDARLLEKIQVTEELKRYNQQDLLTRWSYLVLKK